MKKARRLGGGPGPFHSKLGQGFKLTRREPTETAGAALALIFVLIGMICRPAWVPLARPPGVTGVLGQRDLVVGVDVAAVLQRLI